MLDATYMDIKRNKFSPLVLEILKAIIFTSACATSNPKILADIELFEKFARLSFAVLTDIGLLSKSI
jgi:hypothetical protein